MTLDEQRANAYLSQLNKKTSQTQQETPAGQGFKKFSDAIPENGFQKKTTTPPPAPASRTELPKDKESVYRRVAKFLVLIGENEAAKILPHLPEEQIMKIVPEIASVRNVSKEEATVILAEFKSLQEQSRETGGMATAREILEKAYGSAQAEKLLQKAVPYGSGKPFDYLADTDNEKIYLLLKDESEVVQAIVISHLEPQKAASVINMMEAESKKALILHMARMEAVSPEVIHRIDKSLHEKAISLNAEKSENIDGRNALVEILKNMSSGSEKNILDYLADEDPGLSDDLRSRMFTFEDVVNAEDRFIQEKLRDMADAEVVYLIAGKTDSFREKILSNVSMNRREQILSDEELLKPFKKSEVDKITTSFVSYLRKAYDQGALRISGRNDEDYI